jgi:hypothetical protein
MPSNNSLYNNNNNNNNRSCCCYSKSIFYHYFCIYLEKNRKIEKYIFSINLSILLFFV